MLSAAALVIGTSPSTDQRRDGDLAGFTMSRGVGERVLLGAEPFVLVGALDRRAGQLADLEPQQIDLARPRPLITAERGERRVDLGQPRPSRAQRFEIGSRRSGRAHRAARPSTAGSDGRADRGGRRVRAPSSASVAAVASRPLT